MGRVGEPMRTVRRDKGEGVPWEKKVGSAKLGNGGSAEWEKSSERRGSGGVENGNRVIVGKRRPGLHGREGE